MQESSRYLVVILAMLGGVVVLVGLCFVGAIAAGYAFTRWQRRRQAGSSDLDQYQPPTPPDSPTPPSNH